LRRPIYDLTGAEAYNLPISESNFEEWDHRLVRITGR